MEKVDITDDSNETRNDFIKMILGSVAGFIVGKLVENGIDAFITHRRNKV